MQKLSVCTGAQADGSVSAICSTPAWRILTLPRRLEGLTRAESRRHESEGCSVRQGGRGQFQIHAEPYAFHWHGQAHVSNHHVSLLHVQLNHTASDASVLSGPAVHCKYAVVYCKAPQHCCVGIYSCYIALIFMNMFPCCNKIPEWQATVARSLCKGDHICLCLKLHIRHQAWFICPAARGAETHIKLLTCRLLRPCT